jgi:hypothetical protein
MKRESGNLAMSNTEIVRRGIPEAGIRFWTGLLVVAQVLVLIGTFAVYASEAQRYSGWGSLWSRSGDGDAPRRRSIGWIVCGPSGCTLVKQDQFAPTMAIASAALAFLFITGGVAVFVEDRRGSRCFLLALAILQIALALGTQLWKASMFDFSSLKSGFFSPEATFNIFALSLIPLCMIVLIAISPKPAKKVAE